MSNTSTTGAEPPGPSGRRRSPGTRKEDWIGDQLQRVYDDALREAIPQEMLDLLDALDDGQSESSRK